MPVTVRKLERRLARSRALIAQQSQVITDLMTRLDAPLCGPMPSPHSPIERIDRPEASGTSIAFSSLGWEHGLVAAEFTGVLRETTDTLVFVIDFRRRWFQDGLSPTADTRLGDAAALAETLAPLPRPWRFVGSSAGAWAALYFGAHLKADTIFAFAPQTYLDAATVKRFTGDVPKASNIDITDPQADLARVLDSTPLSGQATLFLSEDNRMDNKHAEHVAGIPGLTRVAYPGKTHHVAYHLRKSGQLGAVLNGKVAA